uniref:Uncharacterized protein n=1 Tax=Ciona savignyi TaxID=51511 RepID=H2ZML7_CIOSA
LGRVLVDTDAQATSSNAPVYTTQESIAQKVHGVDGWKELFSSAGFCLKNQLEDLPAVVVFPQFDSNTKEIAQSVLKCMKTFSDLPNAILESLGWLGLSPYTCQSVLLCLEDLFVALNGGVARDFSFNRKLWQTDGCSQLFQLLGM